VDVTLKYIIPAAPEIGVLTETSEEKDYDVLFAKSLQEKDAVEHFPAIQQRLLDGSFREYLGLQRRVFQIAFGVIKEKADRVFLVDWILHRERRVVYSGTEYRVALDGATGLTFDHAFDLDFARSLTMNLIQRGANLLLTPGEEDLADKKGILENVEPSGVSVPFVDGDAVPESYPILQDATGDYTPYAIGIVGTGSAQRLIDVNWLKHPDFLEVFPAETADKIYWATFKFTQ